MKHSISILFLLLSVATQAQLSGYLLLDGIYGFAVELNPSDDSFMEGHIVYERDSERRNLVATTRDDTLRCQEIDDYLNPVSTMFLIKNGNRYEGEWYDESNGFVLPATLYINSKKIKETYEAHRYPLEWNTKNNQKLFEIPLSPTVNLGKYIKSDQNHVVSFSSNKSFSQTTHYTKTGVIKFEKEVRTTIESTPVENYQYFEENYSIEALIPNFGEPFVDSLQSALVRWKDALGQTRLAISTNRFPQRYYAICDLDYWTEDWVSGSFEYVGPKGFQDGFTFIFDRKNGRFISFDELIRSGDWDEITKPLTKDYVGISFDYYGIIFKGKFNPITDRADKHLAWAELDMKLKRKLTDIQN